MSKYIVLKYWHCSLVYSEACQSRLKFTLQFALSMKFIMVSALNLTTCSIFQPSQIAESLFYNTRYDHSFPPPIPISVTYLPRPIFLITSTTCPTFSNSFQPLRSSRLLLVLPSLRFPKGSRNLAFRAFHCIAFTFSAKSSTSSFEPWA